MTTSSAMTGPSSQSGAHGPEGTGASPRVCYLVLSHVDAPQVLALVRRIRALSPRAAVLVRHDQRRERLDEAQVRAAGGRLLRSEIAVRWGDWTMTATMLEALDAVRDANDPDWTVILSGQDWPARRLDEWEATLEGCDAVVRAEPLVPRAGIVRDVHQMLDDRTRFRWHRFTLDPAIERSLPFRAAAAIWHRTLDRVRLPVAITRLPDGDWTAGVRTRAFEPLRPLYKGEQWVALSRAAVESLHRFREQEPRLHLAFQTSLVADEAYIQTVLAHDPTIRVRDGRISWHRFRDEYANRPEPVHLSDVPAIAEGGAPFARKVSSADRAVMQRLDDLAGSSPPLPLGR